MPKIKVVYSEKQVSDPGDQPIAQKGYTASPSANKPKEVAEALKGSPYDIEFVEPVALTREDFYRAHTKRYVDAVMDLKEPNGFGTISQSVVDSLPYTNGAQYTAAKLATATEPTCALVSGFHHAAHDNWDKFGWFCTFNGLVIAAAKLLEEGMKKVAIIDCDMHWGNGTDDILYRVPELREKIYHLTFGKHFLKPNKAAEYLSWLAPDGLAAEMLAEHKPDVIIYQAGADVHVDDPYGGVLTTEQMYERDLRMFRIAKNLNIPLTWNLAGGYQVGPNGEISKVLRLHMNTFRACSEVY
jgi:acetoin utilization deacetylase AcuC-like enzyme